MVRCFLWFSFDVVLMVYVLQNPRLGPGFECSVCVHYLANKKFPRRHLCSQDEMNAPHPIKTFFSEVNTVPCSFRTLNSEPKPGITLLSA